MPENEKFKELKYLASDITLLYVEDNEKLREQALQLLEKFFKKVFTAKDGEDGIRLFKELKSKPKIVITDIQMPKMDGLEMTRRIHKISPQTKVMVTSAYDDTEYLLEAINVGVFRYLKKPLKISTLYNELLDGLKQFEAEENSKLFHLHIQEIFDNQYTLLILYNNQKPIIVNNAFVDYFRVENLDDFIEGFASLGAQFLEHENFLYNDEKRDWFKEASSNLNKMYHVKMKNLDGELNHFIFKMVPISQKENHFLVSMDDITELNLLKEFDETKTPNTKEDKKIILKLLETIKRNNSEIKIENLYKGLTIINKGSIKTLSEGKIELKTSYLQQRGAQYEKQLVIMSELFPRGVICNKIKNIDFEKQTIEVDDLNFTFTYPSKRKSIRLEVEDEHKISIINNGYLMDDGVRILDLSLEAVKVSLFSLPASFKVDDEIELDFTLSTSKGEVNFKSKAIVFKIIKTNQYYEIIAILKIEQSANKILVDYLVKRQMKLIKEFKGLNLA